MKLEVLNLLYINKESMILAGGSVVDILNGRYPKDYDLFCIRERPKMPTGDEQIWIETNNSLTNFDKIQVVFLI